MEPDGQRASRTDANPCDLGKLLGNCTRVVAILSGKRALSKAHVRVLADHFKVEPERKRMADLYTNDDF